MKLLDKIYTSVESFVIERAGSSKIFAEYYNRTTQKADWKRQATTLRNKEIKDFKLALTTATDPDNPRRGELMRLYQSFETDTHLYSCVDQRILPIQCADFKLVNDKGEEDLEAHMLLEKPWFLDLIRKVVMSTFTGTTLIELFDLNENMEVKEVGEIPQSNFIPQSGVILREEWDTNGVSYREGAYKDYYFQVGSDNNLGLFYQLSIIIMAKKLGLGSWLAYVDKFGVPPVFVTTDRMDSKRVDELFEMMTNFRSNFFTILQGNEKIEMPQGHGVDAHNTFKSLFDEIGNNEISKRMLGGTGTTTEKSFVGSAEVHERMLKMRNKVDKLLFKFYFNEEIKPRLVKLSPVYAPLDKLRFEFDDTETLTLKELIATIKDLSQYYEFDINELVKITGLPITKIKGIIAQGTEPTPLTGQKKKPNANVGTGLSFAPMANTSWRLYAATWDAAIERLATQLFNGEVKPADLDRDLVLKNYAAFNKYAAEAWGEDYYSNEITRKMRDNMMKFSGSKAYQLMDEIHSLKSDGLTKEQFIEQSKSIVNKHNETWLNTEAKYIANATSSAHDFNQYLDDIDIYPNLKCRTMEDEAVRESHRHYDGLVKPVKDWIKTPPFDFGCRCFLEQTTDPATNGTVNIIKSDRFADNPALTGEFFTDKHPYFENTPKSMRQKVHDNMQEMKKYSPYNRVETSKAGNKVYVSDFYDEYDLPDNLKSAHKVADFIEGDVYIRPHIHSSTGIKNPEFGIEKPNNLGDLKTFDPEISKSLDNFFSNGLKDCHKKGCQYAIMDITSAAQDDIEKVLVRRLCGSIKPGTNEPVNQIVIIRGNKVAKISRKQIDNRDFKALMDSL